MIKPELLRDANVRSVSRERGKLYEHERDVAKLWVDGEVIISMIGIENQTSVDPDISIRLMGYDGDSYRSEVDDDEPYKPKRRYPVLTFVLYYGERKWSGPLLLSERIDVPKKLLRFFNDYRVWLFDIPRMTDKQRRMLKSDFAIVADYFTQVERTGDYIESPQEITHPDSVLKLMSAVTGDRRFEEAQNSFLDDERRNFSMVDIFAKVEARGEARGISIGEARGEARGIISMGRKFHIPDADILSQLMDSVKCSTAEAQRMLSNYA